MSPNETAPRASPLLTLGDVAGRLKKTERWMKDFLRAHPCGRKAGRTRLFTEQDFRQLELAVTENGASLADDPSNDDAYERVYVVGFGSYIKIRTSKTARGRRIRNLQTSIPEKLVTYAHLEGGRELEEVLHRKFRMYRLLGEWFSKCGDVAEWIDAGCPVTRFRTARGFRYETRPRS